MKQIFSKVKNFSTLRALPYAALPLSVLNCNNEGDAGQTPMIGVVGAQCSIGADTGLKVLISNSSQWDARFKDYVSGNRYKEDTGVSCTGTQCGMGPAQSPSIVCRAGSNIWTNTSPITVQAGSSVKAILNCKENDGKSEYGTGASGPYINPKNDSKIRSNCVVGPAQSLVCWALPLVKSGECAVKPGAVYTTVNCVDELK